jgi:predicted amino acid-binding ACT domain protein
VGVAFGLMIASIDDDAFVNAIICFIGIVGKDNYGVVFSSFFRLSAPEKADLNDVEVAVLVFFFEFLDLIRAIISVAWINVLFIDVMDHDSILGWA